MRVVVAVAMLAACGDNLPGPTNGHLFDGKVWGGNVAAADGWVYFTTYGEGDDGGHHAVWRVSRDGGAAEPIWDKPRGIFGKGMAIAAGRLYWSEAVDEQQLTQGVFAMSTRGGNETQLGTFTQQQAAYDGVSFDGGHVYAASGLEVLDIAGGAQTIAYSGGLSWMVHRNGHLYVLTGNRLLADGALLATVAAPSDEFAVDDHAAYIGDGALMRRIPLDATTTAAMLFASGRPSAVVVGPHQVYALVQFNAGAQLEAFDFETGLTHTITTDVRTIGSLATDDTSVYVAECCDNGFVARFDL